MIAFTKWVLLVLVGVQMSLGQDLTDYDLGFDNPLFNIWNGNRSTRLIFIEENRNYT